MLLPLIAHDIAETDVLHAGDGLDHGMAVRSFLHIERLVQAELSDAEFLVELGDALLELLSVLRLFQGHSQLQDTVPDPFVEYPGHDPRRVVVRQRAGDGDLLVHQGGRQVEELLQDHAVMQHQVVQASLYAAHDLAARGIGIFIVCKAECQETVPEISLEAVGPGKIHQLVGRGVEIRRRRADPPLCLPAEDAAEPAEQVFVLKIAVEDQIVDVHSFPF